jgi:hypothetical protein
MQAVYKSDTPPGPAGRWLIERLVTLSDAAAAPPQETVKATKGKRRGSPEKRAPARTSRR